MEKFRIPAICSDPTGTFSGSIKSTGFLNGGCNHHTLLCCISMHSALYIYIYRLCCPSMIYPNEETHLT